MDSRRYDALVFYISNHSYPEGGSKDSTQKKRVKRKSDQTKCSQLYRETVKVVSTDEVRRVIKACHDEGSTSGVTKPIRKWPEGTIGQE